MTADVVAVKAEDFAGGAEHSGTAINAWIKGNADYAALDALEMLLDRVHSEASRLGVKEAVIDLRQLEFMNSSGLKCIISWISEIQEMEEDRQYKVRFISNPKMYWQKRSLVALHGFAKDLITIDEQ